MQEAFSIVLTSLANLRASYGATHFRAIRKVLEALHGLLKRDEDREQKHIQHIGGEYLDSSVAIEGINESPTMQSSRLMREDHLPIWLRMARMTQVWNESGWRRKWGIEMEYAAHAIGMDVTEAATTQIMRHWQAQHSYLLH